MDDKMAFEDDPEGYKIACRYAGRSFDKPQIVEHEVFLEYEGKWSIDDFLALISDASEAIPEDCRASANVEMHVPGYDGSTSLRITYTGPESADTVADRVRRCVKYVANHRAGERADYERLKKKFQAS